MRSPNEGSYQFHVKRGIVMRYSTVVAAGLMALALSACEKKETVIQPAPAPAPAPAPPKDTTTGGPVPVPGPPGAPGPEGQKGEKGEAGKPGGGTTIIVPPADDKK